MRPWVAHAQLDLVLSHLLITVLARSNYNLRLRVFSLFFTGPLKSSNLWWLSGMSILPLLLLVPSLPHRNLGDFFFFWLFADFPSGWRRIINSSVKPDCMVAGKLVKSDWSGHDSADKTLGNE